VHATCPAGNGISIVENADSINPKMVYLLGKKWLNNAKTVAELVKFFNIG
jgi:hypothetical protein